MSIGQILPGYSYGAPAGLAGTGGTAGTAGTASPLLGNAAQANPLAALSQGQLGGQGIMGQFMQLMLMLMQLLMTILAGQGQARAADAGGPSGFLSPASGGGGGTNAAGSGEVTNLASRGVTADGSARIANVDGNASERDALDNSLAAIAKDPEGAALLKEAQARGVTIEAGDPGGANVAGVTLTQGGKSKIIVRDPNNIKTIVHELVHAVSTQDGNSKHEEGIADVVGYRITQRVTGQQTQNQNTIYNNKINVAGYANLARANGIENSLAQLGISAFA